MRRYTAYQDDYGDWFVNVTEEAAAEFVSYESALAYAEEQARKATSDAIEKLGGAAKAAVCHVAMANYASRESEANEWIDDAIRALMDTRRDGE